MDNSNINFSSLEELPKSSSFSNLKSGDTTTIYITLGIFGLFFIFIIGSAFSPLEWLFPLITVFFIAEIFIYAFRYALIGKGNVNEIFAIFSKDNSFSFTAENQTIDENGTLFQNGDSKRERRVIEGTFARLPFKLSDFYYETGSGKSRYYYDVRVARFTLPRQLPHMVIDCLVEPGENNQSVLPINFDKSQALQLEGDFYKYFTLYAPDAYAVSALTILAPDVMEALLKMHSLCDIEMIDNYIYFYFPDHEVTSDQYKQVFLTISEVMDKIGDKLVRADIFSNVTQAKVSATPAMSPLVSKKHTFTWYNGLSVIIFVGMFYTFIFNRNPINIIVFQLLFGVIVVVSVLGQAWSAAKRNRLRRQMQQRYH